MKVLYFSTVNWKWIKQRPHFIAYYIAQKGHIVEYLSLTPLGKSKIKRKQSKHLNIHDLYTIPFTHKFKLVEWFNRLLVKLYLNKHDFDVIILTNPLQYLFLPKRILDKTLIYECMDNIPYFYDGNMRRRMLKEEVHTLKLVDGVIASSKRLEDQLSNRHSSINKKIPYIQINNALDKETILKKPQFINLKEPNLVYIGTVGRWLDWNVIRNFAKRNPKFTIYLVGPCEFRMKEKLEQNIITTGAIEHSEIMHYIYSGNIMLLPFKVNELTEAVDPVKMYEYISYNKPVISSYWAELDKFKHEKIYYYNNYVEFEKYALQWTKIMNQRSELNHAFIEEHNWEQRVEQYLSFLNEVHSTGKE